MFVRLLTMFGIYSMVKNVILRIVLPELFILYFLTAREVTVSIYVKDAGYYFTILWDSRNF